MKTLQINTIKKKISILILAILVLHPLKSQSCTIVSAIAKNGEVWNANNEDGPFGVSNFINVYPKSENNRYGFYTLCYLSPTLGHGAAIQGGMNEAGLTFDFNAIEAVSLSQTKNKNVFEGGNEAILPYILGHLETTEQVIAFFETYWFENGFTTAQMHVADRQGDFAIISASGIQRFKDSKSLISTNFDICGKENGSDCWRYPVAERLLAEREINFETMKEICLETAQKEGQTMYSNIQNLTTGDLWFFSKHDPGNLVETNIHDLLEKGQKSYSFSKLNDLLREQRSTEKLLEEPQKLSGAALRSYEGIYGNSFTGEASLTATKDGLELCMAQFPCERLVAVGNQTFKIKDYDLYIRFEKEEGMMARFKLYENGFWSFTAERTEASR